jgi:hypothetical protein
VIEGRDLDHVGVDVGTLPVGGEWEGQFATTHAPGEWRIAWPEVGATLERYVGGIEIQGFDFTDEAAFQQTCPEIRRQRGACLAGQGSKGIQHKGLAAVGQCIEDESHEAVVETASARGIDAAETGDYG